MKRRKMSVLHIQRTALRRYRGITRLWGAKGAPHMAVLKGEPRVLVGILIGVSHWYIQILWRGR